MSINCPRIAKFIRRAGFWLGAQGKHFEPDGGYQREQQFLKSLFKSAGWQSCLDKLTDREIVKVMGQYFDFRWDTIEDAILTEISFRLVRANGGHTDYDFDPETHLPLPKEFKH